MFIENPMKLSLLKIKLLKGIKLLDCAIINLESK